MENYKVTIHTTPDDNGNASVTCYPDAISPAHALLEAAQYAVQRELNVITVEVSIN